MKMNKNKIWQNRQEQKKGDLPITFVPLFYIKNKQLSLTAGTNSSKIVAAGLNLKEAIPEG